MDPSLQRNVKIHLTPKYLEASDNRSIEGGKVQVKLLRVTENLADILIKEDKHTTHYYTLWDLLKLSPLLIMESFGKVTVSIQWKVVQRMRFSKEVSEQVSIAIGKLNYSHPKKYIQ